MICHPKTCLSPFFPFFLIHACPLFLNSHGLVRLQKKVSSTKYANSHEKKDVFEVGTWDASGDHGGRLSHIV
jgi:hypothetical protein